MRCRIAAMDGNKPKAGAGSFAPISDRIWSMGRIRLASVHASPPVAYDDRVGSMQHEAAPCAAGEGRSPWIGAKRGSTVAIQILAYVCRLVAFFCIVTVKLFNFLLQFFKEHATINVTKK